MHRAHGGERHLPLRVHQVRSGRGFRRAADRCRLCQHGRDRPLDGHFRRGVRFDHGAGRHDACGRWHRGGSRLGCAGARLEGSLAADPRHPWLGRGKGVRQRLEGQYMHRQLPHRSGHTRGVGRRCGVRQGHGHPGRKAHHPGLDEVLCQHQHGRGRRLSALQGSDHHLLKTGPVGNGHGQAARPCHPAGHPGRLHRCGYRHRFHSAALYQDCPGAEHHGVAHL